VRRLLSELAAAGVAQPIFLCRELPKIHEEVIHGTPSALLETMSDPRGEFTLVIPPGQGGATDQHDAAGLPDDAEVFRVFGQTTEHMTGSKRELARATADRLGMTTKEVYRALERLKK
jgi:16S rRNA C1402 (ribose-2'-O) methylase RsmI